MYFLVLNLSNPYIRIKQGNVSDFALVSNTFLKLNCFNINSVFTVFVYIFNLPYSNLIFICNLIRKYFFQLIQLVLGISPADSDYKSRSSRYKKMDFTLPYTNFLNLRNTLFFRQNVIGR